MRSRDGDEINPEEREERIRSLLTDTIQDGQNQFANRDKIKNGIKSVDDVASLGSIASSQNLY